MNALFEQAHQKLLETQDPELESLCDEMAKYIPTTAEYTFTFLNSDTHTLSLTYAPNQVGTWAFIHECKKRLTELTGHPAETMDLNNHEGQLYCVVLKEAPSPPRWKHYVFSKTTNACYSIPHDADISELEIGKDGEQRGLLNAFPVVQHYNEIYDESDINVEDENLTPTRIHEENDFDDDECDELWKEQQEEED